MKFALKMLFLHWKTQALLGLRPLDPTPQSSRILRASIFCTLRRPAIPCPRAPSRKVTPLSLGMDKQEKNQKLVGLDPSDYECCIQWGWGALKFAMCTQNAKKGCFLDWGESQSGVKKYPFSRKSVVCTFSLQIQTCLWVISSKKSCSWGKVWRKNGA